MPGIPEVQQLLAASPGHLGVAGVAFDKPALHRVGGLFDDADPVERVLEYQAEFSLGLPECLLQCPLLGDVDIGGEEHAAAVTADDLRRDAEEARFARLGCDRRLRQMRPGVFQHLPDAVKGVLTVRRIRVEKPGKIVRLVRLFHRVSRYLSHPLVEDFKFSLGAADRDPFLN